MWCARHTRSADRAAPPNPATRRRAAEQGSGAGRLFAGCALVHRLRQPGDLPGAGRGRRGGSGLHAADRAGHHGAAGHCRSIVLAGAASVPGRRRIVHRRPRKPGAVGRAGRRGGAIDRLRADGGRQPDGWRGGDRLGLPAVVAAPDGPGAAVPGVDHAGQSARPARVRDGDGCPGVHVPGLLPGDAGCWAGQGRCERPCRL